MVFLAFVRRLIGNRRNGTVEKDENLSDIKHSILFLFTETCRCFIKGISLKKIGELYDVEKIEIVKPQKPLIKNRKKEAIRLNLA